jgi:hypothetical protein
MPLLPFLSTYKVICKVLLQLFCKVIISHSTIKHIPFYNNNTEKLNFKSLMIVLECVTSNCKKGTV